MSPLESQPYFVLLLRLCVDAVLSVELIDTAAGGCRLLLAGIESMALGADLHVNLLLGRTGNKLIAAVAGYLCLIIGGMDTLSHDFHLFTFQLYSPVII